MSKKCKILTIANNKGGCGKTTTVVNLASALRLQGKTVLAVDLDGQSNLTSSFGEKEDRSFYEALHNPDKGFMITTILPKEGKLGKLDIIPSHWDMSAINGELDNFRLLANLLEPVKSSYDYILIDTPPSLATLTANALYFCDAVLITSQAQYNSVHGLLNLTDIISVMENTRKVKIPYKILFTQVDTRKSIQRMTIEQVQASKHPVCKTMIRSCVSLEECPVVKQDIFRYAPKSKSAEDYSALAEELKNWKI